MNILRTLNPFLTIKALKQDLADTQISAESWNSLYWEKYDTNYDLMQKLREANESLSAAENNALHWNTMYCELYESNTIHADLNGKLRADIDNLEANHSGALDEINMLQSDIDGLLRQSDDLEASFDTLIADYQDQERVIFAHMEERKYLLDTIEDLDGEANDLVDDLIYLSKETSGLLDTIASKEADIKMLNGLLVEGSQSYDKVVEAGEKMAAEFDRQLNNLRSELASSDGSYDDLLEMYDQRTIELAALKTSQTQSLSWVRQAEQALQDYGITIDDTPVGPSVQIDRDTFVNRVALDNVTAAPV